MTIDIINMKIRDPESRDLLLLAGVSAMPTGVAPGEVHGADQQGGVDSADPATPYQELCN